MDWIFDNVEWLFSGIGVSIITLIAYLLKKGIQYKYRIHKKNEKNISEEYVDQSRFISENPPDGAKAVVGESFFKSWTIRNEGKVIWKGRYMKCDPLPQYLKVKTEKIKIPIIKPGQEYILNAEYIVTCEGIYQSNWKMYDENNNVVFPKLKGLGVTIIAVNKYNK